MLVGGSCEAGPGLCLEHFQEGCITVGPAIQAAKVCATYSSATSSSLITMWQGYGQGRDRGNRGGRGRERGGRERGGGKGGAGGQVHLCRSFDCLIDDIRRGGGGGLWVLVVGGGGQRDCGCKYKAAC